MCFDPLIRRVSLASGLYLSCEWKLECIPPGPSPTIDSGVKVIS